MDSISLLPEHRGERYTSVLQRLHDFLQPESYVEIGTLHGDTLALTRCASVAIDPHFQLQQDVIGNKPSCHLFQMTSDDFFAQQNLRQLFGKPVQMAFLDGMHQHEFLLRDFMNIEKQCERSSVVLMHDCLPADRHVARRDPHDKSLANMSPHPDWWAGDVWKAAAIIRLLRPDVVMFGITTPPTGLIAVTNLDPNSNVLASESPRVARGLEGDDDAEVAIREFVGSVPMFPPHVLTSSAWLTKLFSCAPRV